MRLPFAPVSLLLGSLIALSCLGGCSSKTAEEKGAELAGEKIDMAKGIGNALEKKGADASEAVTTGLGNVVHGIERGVGKSGRKITNDESVTKAGLKITRVQNGTPSEKEPGQSLDLYVVADADARGKLRVTAFDALDNEIARSSIDITRSADDAKYERFAMDDKVKLDAITKLVVTFKPAAAPAPK